MSTPILEIKDLHKSFGTKKVHQGVNLQLHEAESIALLGGSGSGKSVLLREIIGLERLDKGEIHYKGQRIDQLSEDELFPIRTHISYAFQSGALFDSSTVFENISYPLIEHSKLTYPEIQQRVSQMLELIDLKGIEKLMPSDLSGGMQKRVGMARAIILGPDIVLYDEPTAGLDPSNTDNVVQLMKRLKKRGLASIFVTHDIPAAIDLCDRILILHEGKIYFNEPTSKFLESTDPIVTKFHLTLNINTKRGLNA